jgi:DNA modification methylase
MSSGKLEKIDSPEAEGGKGASRSSAAFDLTAVQTVSVDDLTLDPANVRAHPQRNLDAMIGSLKRFGQQKPIVVDRDGVVRAGNGLLRAARLLGWEHVAAYMTELDGAEATAFAIADNRTAELSEWIPGSLSVQMQSLIDEGFDLGPLGWDDDDLKELLEGDWSDEGIGEAEPEEGDGDGLDEIPDDVPAITKPGEVVTLGRHTLTCGDCLEVLRSLPESSVDAVVTDPPYGIGFMGKDWDCDVPGDAFAVEALRVLKPGGHLIAFAATRTVHRLTVAIEDAGFEVRDQIAWLQWQGFPKSHDVSKAIDRMKHDREQTLQVTGWINDEVKRAGLTHAEILEEFGFNVGSGQVGHWTATTTGSQPAVPTLEQVPKLLDLLGVDDPPEDIATLLWDLNAAKGEPGPNWWKREVVGPTTPGAQSESTGRYGAWGEGITPTAPATPDAEKWHGWGTALKPSYEPAVLARKPLEGTVADNVLAHGTGGINVDGCRIGYGDQAWPGPGEQPTGYPNGPGGKSHHYSSDKRSVEVRPDAWDAAPLGRWPANIYACPKAGAERGDDNNHPTVKPVKLMRWLVRLVTPPGGTVVEPFCGSGTTLIAAEAEGLTCVAVEREPSYCDITRARYEGGMAK